MDYLYIIIIGLIVLALAKFILKFTFKKIIPLILNIVLGMVILWIVNTFLGLAIPVNLITALVVGLGGVPGVILLIILCIIGVI